MSNRKSLSVVTSFVFILLLTACESDKYNPGKYLSKAEQDSLVYRVIRYAAKLPPNSDHTIKFETRFDPYYKAVSMDYNIKAYYVGDDSVQNVLFTRAARSITPMREAIGCKLKFSGKTIIYYEEVFRTWKMPEELLSERSPILFEKMIKGESLEPYYSKHKGDQYIEFPDDRFVFDAEKRKWIDKELDSLKFN